jgi:Mycobacterial cell wall arabinan synthesis protein/EmbC C-terminal domain/Arabinosyltransferase concanavalin like domain
VKRLLASAGRIPVPRHESMSIQVEPASAPRVVVNGPPGSSDLTSVRRFVLALALAAFALLAAGVAAIGPAQERRDVYTWPPIDRAAAVEGSRYAPLLITRHHPDSLSATTPCAGLADAGADRGDAPVTLIATARQPEAVDGRGLLVTMERGALVTRFGDRDLLRTPWPGPQDTGANCTVRVEFHGNDWRVTSGGRVVGHGRELEPNVSGLYTDLTPSAGLQATLRTGVVDSAPSTRQWLFNGLAVVAGVAALVLLHRSGRGARAEWSPRAGWSRLTRAIRWIDIVVVGAMVVWWVVAPVFFDDGWVMATVLDRPASHGFSVYYDHFGVNYPFVFLPLVVLYGASRISASLLWLRVPVLLVGIVTWGMLRTYVRHLRGPEGRALRLPAMTLGAVFLVGWFSWLETLRPEPAVAVLAALVILAVRRFHHSERLRDVTIAAIAAAVAVSVHPEGIIALAPLVVAIPALYRWAREQRWERWCALAAVALVAGAVLILLAFADTDLKLFRDSGNLFASDAYHGLTWHDELQRYVYLLSDGPYGTVVRRASGLFALVPFALFLTRPDRRRNPDLDLPVLSLMLGVVVLALTPSKWPWQLGTLVPFAALAAAAEVHRLLVEPAGVSRARRLLLALGGSVLASVIAWRGHQFWNPLAIVDVDFGRGGSGFVHVDLSSGKVWAFIVVGLALVAGVIALRRQPRRPATLLRRGEAGLTLLGASALAVSAALVAAVTLALFVVDGFRAPSWSLAKQNVDTVAGSTCGLADDLTVIDPGRGRALPVDGAASTSAAVGALPLAAALRPPLQFAPDGVDPATSPVPGLGSQWGSRVTSGADQGTFVSGWFELDRSVVGAGEDQGRLTLFAAGRINTDDMRLFVQFGRTNGTDVGNVAVEEVPAQEDDPHWRPVLLDALVPVPRDVDRMRLIGVDGAGDRGGWLAFSEPRVVRPEPLTPLLDTSGQRALVAPWLRPYFPCVTQPRVEPGVSEPPDVVLGDVLTDAYPESPMRFVGDLYPVSPLLLVNDEGVIVKEVAAARVDKRLATGTPVSVAARRN